MMPTTEHSCEPVPVRVSIPLEDGALDEGWLMRDDDQELARCASVSRPKYAHMMRLCDNKMRG